MLSKKGRPIIFRLVHRFLLQKTNSQEIFPLGCLPKKDEKKQHKGPETFALKSPTQPMKKQERSSSRKVKDNHAKVHVKN
jgi:hypothetical protein